MKTFEERFTAWLDDGLPAGEHAAFERELAARSDAESLRDEKRLAGQLRNLLHDHLQAPPLPSPDFFNHSIMERISAGEREDERAVAVAGNASPWRRFHAAFRAPESLAPARLLAAGAACLLAAGVGIYALIPSGSPTAPRPGSAVAVNNPTPAPPVPAPAAVEPPVTPSPRTSNDGQYAKNEQPPRPTADLELNGTLQLRVPPGSPVSAVPLHFDKEDVDAIWLNNLPYMPDMNGADPVPAPGENAPAPATPSQP